MQNTQENSNDNKKTEDKQEKTFATQDSNKYQNEKEEEYTLNEYIENINKEILVISKFEKNEQVKKCTYEKGYITQEIYVCLTCSKEKGTVAGICVGCAYKCHDQHEVENLYFKRNFRCDCGNSNFFSACDLQNEKDFKNENNYNHNFKLKYCFCDSEEKDQMVECLICEDWFHYDCLNFNGKFELELNDDQLICRNCLKNKLEFLKEYNSISDFLVLKKRNQNLEDNSNVDNKIGNINNIINYNQIENQEKNISKENIIEEQSLKLKFLGRKRRNCDDNNNKMKQNNTDSLKKLGNISNINEINHYLNLNEENLEEIPKNVKKITQENCLLNYQGKNIINELDKDFILKKEIFENNLDILIDINKFNLILCKCQKCLELYNEKGIKFIGSKETLVDDWENRQILEDKLNEEASQDNEENRQIIDKIDNCDFHMIPEIREMPIEKQIILNQTMNNLTSFFTLYVQDNPPEDNLISELYIKNMLREFESKKKK